MSVVILVDRQRERGGLALQSVLAQDALDDLEILLYDFSPHAAPVRGSDHPRVRVIPVSRSVGFGELRAQAVRDGRAPVVAFLEEHARALPGWAAAHIRRHQEPWAVVSGEVHPANPQRRVSNAIGLLNYLLWAAPAQAGEVSSLPGQNKSYKRDVLLRYGGQLPRLLGADLILDWKLREDGYRLYLDPAAAYAHANESRVWDIMVGTYWWNRMFTVYRAALWRWSWGERAARVVLTPLVPFVRVARQALFLARRRPRRLPAFLVCVPVGLAIHTGAAAGQAVGLLRGMGDSERVFGDYEMNRYRGVPGIAERRD